MIELWAIFYPTGELKSIHEINLSEREAWRRVCAEYRYEQGLDFLEIGLKEVGYTCRKVRIEEVTDEN